MPIGPTQNSPEIVTAENIAGAKPGDTVELDLSGHMELKLSLLVWAVPIAGLIAGAILGVRLHAPLGVGEDPAAMVGALVGFVASYGLLKAVDRRSADDPRLVPHVVRVVRGDSCQALPASTPESVGSIDG